MVSVLIDKNTKKIISIVEGQKLKSTSEYEVYYSNKINESEVLKELNDLNILDQTIVFDIVFKRDALGDVLMMLPVISSLKKEYPYLQIALQTDEWLVPLFVDNPVFDSVVGFNTSISADIEIDLCKIGDFIAKKDGRENKHRSVYYEDFIKNSLENFNFSLDFNSSLNFNESEKYKFMISNDSLPVVVLSPLSKSYFRMWGYKDKNHLIFYKELDLIEKIDYWKFVVLGTTKMKEFDNYDNVINLSGKTDILECATICKYSNFGIVPDSGIMHLMGAMKKNVIALFGNVTEPNYRISQYDNVFPIITPTKDYLSSKYKKKPYCHIPICWDGQVHNCMDTDHEKWCTKSISVDQILNVFKKNIKLKKGISLKNYGYKKYAMIISQSLGEYFDDKDTEILYVGQYGTTGYALACIGTIVDMILSGYNVSWKPIVRTGLKEKRDLYSVLARSSINKKNNPSVLIIHDPPENWEHHYNKYSTESIKKVIGAVCWETEFLPEKWVKTMNADYIDEIWTPSEYNKRVFINSGIVKNIRIIPYVWMGKTLPIVKKSDNYVFYNISEFTERKGIEDMIDIFYSEFDENDKVELVFKTHYKDYSEKNIVYVKKQYKNYMENYKKRLKVNLILKELTEDEILNLHAYGDCYFTPCRGEGFGLPIYDAHMYNNSVIATGYGTHVEFLGKNYHGLIDYKMGKVKNMEDFAGGLYNDHIWAYPDKNHARKLLRNEYEKWLSEK